MDAPTAAPLRVFGSRELRDVLGRFATGITVITTSGEIPHGLTANAFSSLSLDPPLVLVCVMDGTPGAAAIQSNGVFAVNVLAADQEALSRYFASKERPRGPGAFSEVSHSTLVSGAPILDGVCAYLDCTLVADHPGGDHRILVGEVRAIGVDDTREPLLFHRGQYRLLATPTPDAPRADAATAAPDAAAPDAPTSHDAPARATTDDVFADLPPDLVELLGDELRTVRSEAGTVILEQDAPTDEIYVVVEGEVEVYRVDADGREQRLQVLGEGEFFGEVAAVLGGPRTASVRALTPVRLLRMPRTVLAQVLERSATASARLADVARQRS